MKIRFTFGILILGAFCLSSCVKTENDTPSVQKLKLYNYAVQRVKKVHEFYALIDTNNIVFLDDRGEKKFIIEDSLCRTDSTFKFRFTDAISHPNGDIYVLATELRKNKGFLLYVLRLNQQGQLRRDYPKIINITNSYEYDYSGRHNSVNFTIRENGYALGTIHDLEIVAVVNFQKRLQDNWWFRIISLSEDGEVIHKKDYEETYADSWTYMIDILPNNSIVLARGSNLYLEIIQFDPVSFDTIEIYSRDGQTKGSMKNITFSSMHSWITDEVVLVGHADRRNGPLAENFDILCFRYNFLTNEIIDTLYAGLNKNNELCFHSYKDQNNVIHCIGTKREEGLSAIGVRSTLLEVTFNPETGEKDSMELIKNNGFEGLYAEPDNNALYSQIVLGYKFDLSGRQNIQGFLMHIKKQ